MLGWDCQEAFKRDVLPFDGISQNQFLGSPCLALFRWENVYLVFPESFSGWQVLYVCLTVCCLLLLSSGHGDGATHI